MEFEPLPLRYHFTTLANRAMKPQLGKQIISSGFIDVTQSCTTIIATKMYRGVNSDVMNHRCDYVGGNLSKCDKKANLNP